MNVLRFIISFNPAKHRDEHPYHYHPFFIRWFLVFVVNQNIKILERFFFKAVSWLSVVWISKRFICSSLSKNEKLVFKNLDKDIIILPADKAKAIVVMDTNHYWEKINDLLNLQTYKIKSSDPTQRLLRTTNQLIKQSSKRTDRQKRICNSGTLPPRLYGLPKTHRSGVPFRPFYTHNVLSI